VPRFDARPTIVRLAPITAIAVVLTVIGVALDPARALGSYLVAWSWVTTIALGGLAVLMIGYAANVKWIAVVRRLAETIAFALVPCAILFVPLAIGAGHLWPWVHPSPELAKELVPRARWLSLGFFVVRSFVYLILFAIPAVILGARSRRRDAHVPPPEAGEVQDKRFKIGETDVPPLAFERKLSAAFLLITSIAATFAAWDWLMSLAPNWYSTAFGLYMITGALAGGMAAMIVLAARGLAAGWVPLQKNHFHAMGRLLLAFVVLWGYIAYFQAFLIRIGNVPREIMYYVTRVADGWRAILYVLIATHLAIPLPLLIPKRTKLAPFLLAGIALLVLFAHYVDLYWVVIPAIAGPLPSWTDLTALVAVGGVTAIVVAWRAHGTPHVALGDPYLAPALPYETPT
jgi:hypothetical protein